MRRKSTGKRLRFEIFKRDHFTCRYCGAQPPEIVLVPDHIVPVAAGGETTIESLITSCVPCNEGKADRLIELKAIRPDADLLYLETQQEIAELRRFQAAKAARDVEIGRIVSLLQDDWIALSGQDWVPSQASLRHLLGEHSPEVVERALADVALKVSTGYVSSLGDKWLRYLHGVANNMSREHEYGLEA